MAGPNSPRDVAALHRRIVAEQGLVAAAAPVRDFRGRVCAAVNVSAPKFRLGGTRRLAEVGRAVKDVADELSALLGESATPNRVPDTRS